MENKLSLYEAYTANNGNIFESNEPTNLEAFDRLARSGDTLAVNSEGLVITLVLMNNELSVAQGPELVKLIEKRPNSYLLELLEQENRIVEFPIKTKSVSVPIITLLFKTVESYNKLNTFVTMTFGKVLPKYEDKNIAENKMSSIMKGLVDETEAKKGADGKRCWKGKRYAGTENGKDKCIPVKNESAYEKDLEDNEPRIVIGVYGAKSKEFRKKFANQKAQDRFFDHPDREGNYEIHYVQKATVSEGIIVGHDANDPEVAILGGAGTMSLSRLKNKAAGEAQSLFHDMVLKGNFKAAAYNIKQLANTLNTIVSAEEEMEKKYFGEDYTGEFAAEKTAATNPYGGQRDIQDRGSLGEDSSSDFKFVVDKSRPQLARIFKGSDVIALAELSSDKYGIDPDNGTWWVVPKNYRLVKTDIPAKGWKNAKKVAQELYIKFGDAMSSTVIEPKYKISDKGFDNLVNFLSKYNTKQNEDVEEARQPHPLLKAANKNLAGLASGEVQRRERERKAAEKAQRQASKDLDRMLNRKPAKKTKQDLQTLWAKIESVIANSFPDGEPYDQLWPYMQKHGFTQDDVERASKMNGYDDLWDYWNTLTQDIENDAYADWLATGGKSVRTRGTFVETPTDNPTGASGEGGWRRTDMSENAHEMALAKLQKALKNPNVPAEKKKEIAKQIEYQRSQLDKVNEEQLDEKCWKGYKQVGMKKKAGKEVPNCVPKESAIMKGLKR
jgi:hypothetical protein